MRKPYPADLTNAQWKILKPLIPPAKPGGRPREVDMREVLNTIPFNMENRQNTGFLRKTVGENYERRSQIAKNLGKSAILAC